MELIRFILSSFWSWLGVMILIATVCSYAVQALRESRRNRKVSAYRMGDRWKVEIVNASIWDVVKICRKIGKRPKELDCKDGNWRFTVTEDEANERE